ncbi:MAG: hypothetical protein HRU09_08650 [Oligoflexales bacterium]|nr:hypothetical protein [Oligoflexales bacterium]
MSNFLILTLIFNSACTNKSSGGSERTKRSSSPSDQPTEQGKQEEAPETGSPSQTAFPGQFKLATWQGPVALEQSVSAAADLAYVFFDSSDHALALWTQFGEEDDSDKRNFWSNSYSGSEWEGAKVIQADDIGSIVYSAAKFVREPGGNILAIWPGEQGMLASLYIEGTWSNPENIGPSSGVVGDKFSFEAVATANGIFYVIWAGIEAGDAKIWANRYEEGTWGTANMLPKSGHLDGMTPRIKLDQNDVPMAVWMNTEEEGGKTIWFNQYNTQAKTWSEAEHIQNKDWGSASGPPDLSFDSLNRPVAIWSEYHSGVLKVHVSSFINSNWVPATPLDIGDATAATKAKIYHDPKGNGIILWTEFDGNSYKLWANRLDAQKNVWEPAILLHQGAADSNQDHEFFFDKEGNGIALWGKSQNSQYEIWGVRFDGSWVDPELISNSGKDSYNPFLSFDSKGNAIIVWAERASEEGTFDIWSNRLKRALNQ